MTAEEIAAELEYARNVPGANCRAAFLQLTHLSAAVLRAIDAFREGEHQDEGFEVSCYEAELRTALAGLAEQKFPPGPPMVAIDTETYAVAPGSMMPIPLVVSTDTEAVRVALEASGVFVPGTVRVTRSCDTVDLEGAEEELREAAVRFAPYAHYETSRQPSLREGFADRTADLRCAAYELAVAELETEFAGDIIEDLAHAIEHLKRKADPLWDAPTIDMRGRRK